MTDFKRQGKAYSCSCSVPVFVSVLFLFLTVCQYVCMYFSQIYFLHYKLYKWFWPNESYKVSMLGPTPPGGDAPAHGSDEEEEEEDEGRCAILTVNGFLGTKFLYCLSFTQSVTFFLVIFQSSYFKKRCIFFQFISFVIFFPSSHSTTPTTHDNSLNNVYQRPLSTFKEETSW